MRSAIIIPARLQSSRLPRKPLALLDGAPLVVQVARQALLCAGVDAVAIATDAPAVAAAAAAHGVRCLTTAASHRSGSERVAEAAEILQADCVINVQGDEPFVDPLDLQDVLQAVQAEAGDIVTLRQPLTCPQEIDDPATVKVVCDDAGQALYFSRAAIPFATDPQHPPLRFGHIGVYGCRRAVLRRWQQAPVHPLETCEGLEQLRALAMGMRIAVLAARSRGRGIDTPADLAWARQRVAMRGTSSFPRRHVEAANDAPQT